MFDVGFWELAIIAVIALLVIGPDRLPKAARTAGLWVGRARRLVSEVKSDIDREIRESDLADLKEAGEELKKTTRSVRSVGSKFIQETELDDIKNVGEELKAAKSDIESNVESVEKKLSEPSSSVSEGMSIEDTDQPVSDATNTRSGS